jgi:glycosyltransferase involved in cell wall biosynthesis/peptidoglycan/xylan/chitin deacetylase (PgdA/CDA1 family)
MEISVIIPTYNRRALLARTLQTIFNQDFPGDEYEVIVVVDGSSDGTAEMLSELQPRCTLRVISQANRGQAAARNVGIDAARARLVLFLDDDLLVPPHLLRAHVAAHTDADPSVVFGSVLVAEDSRPGLGTEFTQRFAERFYGALEKGTEPYWPEYTHVLPNTSVPTAVLRQAGGFDERFYRAHEDTELGIRLWKQGVRFRFLDRAAVYQVFTKELCDIVFGEAELGGKGEVLLCEKHAEYRQYSDLAPPPGLFKRTLLKGFLSSPVASARTLSTVLGLLGHLDKSELSRWFGIRLGQLCQKGMIVTSACRQVGGLQQFYAKYWLRVPVLMYHHVGYEDQLEFLSVTPEAFARQMQWLVESGYHPITASEWATWCNTGNALPPKPVLLTFDDGYSDLAKYAFPALRAHGFSATVFIVTAALGGTNAWDRAKGLPVASLLSAGQIREWSRMGIEFGAHTRTHCELTSCTSAELEDEIIGSGQDLADLLGHPPASFAYPYGIYDDNAVRLVQQTYDVAFGTEPGLDSVETHRHLQNRTMVFNDSRLRFDYRLRVGRDLHADVRRRLHLEN